MNCTFQLLFEIYKLGKVRFQNVAKEVINDFQIMSISTITYLQKFRHKFLFDFFMEKHFMFYQVLLTNRKYSFKQIACQPPTVYKNCCILGYRFQKLYRCMITMVLQFVMTFLDFNLLLELCVKRLQQLLEAILMLLALCINGKLLRRKWFYFANISKYLINYVNLEWMLKYFVFILLHVLSQLRFFQVT